ncbi:MAG: hypothetical protein AAFX99_05835 [Myxococcota bacterium]
MLGLEQLDAQEREALAAQHGAPSARLSVLERHLLAAAQVQRRVGSLSDEAREALKHLVEAALPSLPLDALKIEVVEELRTAWLVTLMGSPAQVVVSDPVSTASLEPLGALPCRLRLMLTDMRLLSEQGVDKGEEALIALEGRLAGVLGEPTTRSGVPGRARIMSWLGDRRVVERIVQRLDAPDTLLLWDLTAAGGVMDGERALGHDWSALIRLGMVWKTADDVRIAAEVLRALLEVQLEQRATTAVQEARQLRQSGVLETVHPMPVDPVREVVDLVRVMWSGGPGRSWSSSELRHAGQRRPLEVSIHEALLELLVGMGVVSQAPEGGFLLAGPPSVERGSLAWASSLVEGMVQASASGWVSRPTRRALLAMLDVADTAEVPPDVPDESELHGWSATPPALAGVSSREFATSTGATLGAAWLGLLWVGQMASLQPGRRYVLGDLARLARALVSVVHSILRLDGPLYMREPPLHPQAWYEEPVSCWLDALAVPLGWAESVERPHDDELGKTLSLFAPLEEEPVAISSPPQMEVRVLRRVPQHAPQVDRPWIVLLGGLVSGKDGLGRLTASPQGGLAEEVAVYREEHGTPEHDLALSMFVECMREHTAAQQLRALTERDVVRFLVHGMWRLTPDDGRARVRRAMDAVMGLLRWSAARAGRQSPPWQVDPDRIQAQLEGPLLRLCSAWDAFQVYHRPHEATPASHRPMDRRSGPPPDHPRLAQV